MDLAGSVIEKNDCVYKILKGKNMDWNEILKEVISGSILLAIGGIGGWFSGLFKGKKESSTAIERKNEFYQPLIDDIEKYSTFDWSIMEKIKTNF